MTIVLGVDPQHGLPTDLAAISAGVTLTRRKWGRSLLIMPPSGKRNLAWPRLLEDSFVQALVAEAGVKALDKSVLRRYAPATLQACANMIYASRSLPIIYYSPCFLAITSLIRDQS